MISASIKDKHCVGRIVDAFVPGCTRDDMVGSNVPEFCRPWTIRPSPTLPFPLCLALATSGAKAILGEVGHEVEFRFGLALETSS